MIFQRENEEENNLNYQLKKIMHMVELQIMDIQSTLHYVQKKHAHHQIKEILSQIYNIFNETQAVFRHCKAFFLHTTVKKLMNSFGIIFFMLTDNLQNRKISEKQVLLTDNKNNNISGIESAQQKQILKRQGAKTEQNVSYHTEINHRPLGGISLYNQNYQRHICLSSQEKQKVNKSVQKTSLTKDEFKQQIMDQLNEKLLDNPHPDEIIDIFTFKFKYGRQKQVVTFHDQLLSIAKFFKDAQNQAFDFLNKTKDQNANITYNNTFSDVMSQVKLQKEIKLQQFTKKIKKAFVSIKSKTEDKWNEIQNKLVEVNQIKNSMKPPQIREQATQTSYNIDQQLKYLTKKLESAEQRYKLMQQLKKKEVEQNTIMQIQMENQLSLKAREIVYLKINLEQNKVMISTLNKKIKIFSDNHKRIKKTINLSANSKEQGIKKLSEIVDAEDIASECASEQQKNSLQSLKKQKKMAKMLVLDARRRTSLIGQKQMFSKRFTQQLQGITSASKDILERWGLSQISQQADMQTLSNPSLASNKNIQLSLQNFKKNTNSIKKVNEPQNLSAGISAHSIRSVAEQNRSRKQSRQKTKTNSQFLPINRPSSFLMKSKEQNMQSNDDSLFNQSDSLSQSETNAENNDQNIKRLQEMYKRQMNKTKNNIIQRKTAVLSHITQRSLLKSKFKTDESQTKKSSSSKMEHSGSKSNSLHNKTAGLSNVNSRYLNNSTRLSTAIHKMNSIDEKQQQKDLHAQLKTLQTKNKQLQQRLEKKSKPFFMCNKQINLSIEPLSNKKAEEIRQMIKVKSQAEQDTNYTDLKTDKKSELRSEKIKKSLYSKERKVTTQSMVRPITQTSSLKQNNEGFYGKNEFNSQKSKTQHSSQLNLLENLKKGNIEQIKKLSSGNSTKKDFLQKFKTLQSQKDGQNEDNHLSKKSNLLGKQNKGSLIDLKRSIPQRKSQIIEKESQQKEEQEQQTKVKQLAFNCKTKKQFKNKIYQIHWLKCGKNCKHLQQYMNKFSKYKEEAKAKLKLHVQNLNSSIDHRPQLPSLSLKK